MHTLLLNGSPHRRRHFLNCPCPDGTSRGGEVTYMEAYRTNVSPCIDCRYCWTHPACAIDDAMQTAYRAIDCADQIVIASPIYFAELTGPLLSWASRLQFLYASRVFRHAPYLTEKYRRGAVILVDGGDGCWETAAAMGRRLLRTMGATYEDLIYYSGTDHAGCSNCWTTRKLCGKSRRSPENTTQRNSFDLHRRFLQAFSTFSKTI